jgi:DsbC/DsbD-like thiol-disulfide interchange protein
MSGWFLILFFQWLSCNAQTNADSIVQVLAPSVSIQVGENQLIPVYISVKKGFHIQANKVTDEFIIPTTLEIDSSEVLSIGKQKYPKPKKFRLTGTTQNMPVYDGTLKILVQCKVKEGVQKGKYTLQAKLHYQACDHKTCFFPKTLVFPIEIQVK